MSVRRPWVLPLVPLYGAALRLEAGLRERGLLKPRWLPAPVLSVGSLSAGGAGKTPVVLALAQLMRERGWDVDILSRGYGRSGTQVERVDPGAPAAAERYGDEPVLLADRSGLAVWVGSRRYDAGRAAEASAADSRSRGRLHLLDDGFQHRELGRVFDIVLVTAEDLADTLLPAGNLREPPRALALADAIVLREEEAEALTPRLRPLLRDGVPLWTIRRTLRFPQPLGIFTAGLRPLAFCAIARPDGFLNALREAGCGVIDAVVLRDHARYGDREVEQILRFARELNATGLLTTEKDAVKLSPALRERLSAAGPLAVVALDASFVYKSPVVRAIEARLEWAKTVAPSHPGASQPGASEPGAGSWPYRAPASGADESEPNA